MQGAEAKAKSDKTRDRYDGPISALADALRPSVTCPNWLVYTTNPGDRMDKDTIRAHGAVACAALATYRPTGRFVKTTWKQAMQLLVNELSPATLHKWFFGSEDHKSQWPGIQASRMRVLLRHWSQAVVKARGFHTGWVNMVRSSPAKSSPNPHQAETQGWDPASPLRTGLPSSSVATNDVADDAVPSSSVATKDVADDAVPGLSSSSVATMLVADDAVPGVSSSSVATQPVADATKPVADDAVPGVSLSSCCHQACGR